MNIPQVIESGEQQLIELMCEDAIGLNSVRWSRKNAEWLRELALHALSAAPTAPPSTIVEPVPEDTLNRLLVGKATEGDQMLAYNALKNADPQPANPKEASTIEPRVAAESPSRCPHGYIRENCDLCNTEPSAQCLVVPVEPTDEMLIAMAEANVAHDKGAFKVDVQTVEWQYTDSITGKPDWQKIADDLAGKWVELITRRARRDPENNQQSGGGG